MLLFTGQTRQSGTDLVAAVLGVRTYIPSTLDLLHDSGADWRYVCRPKLFARHTFSAELVPIVGIDVVELKLDIVEGECRIVGPHGHSVSEGIQQRRGYKHAR